MSTERTQAIEDAASAWLIRRDSGEWTPGDAARLQEWLNASSLHRVAFWRLEHAWEEAARLKALGAGVTGHLPPPRGEWNLTPFFDSPDQRDPPEHLDAETDTGSGGSYDTDQVAAIGRDLATVDLYPVRESRMRTRRALKLTALASAATVLLAIAGGAYLCLEPTGDRYATPVGGLASVPLQDGSHITLNTATEVHVALTGKERDIELARGEAFFEVAHDATRPFVVHVGNKRVIAVGTQFSVRRDGDEIRVVVSEGTVRLEPWDQPHRVREDRKPTLSFPSSGPALSGSGTGIDASSGSSADVVLLPAGSVAHAGSAGVLVQKETESKTQEQLSWRTGVLMFRDRTLGEAAAEFNRYNERQIVIRDPAIANLKIEGNFRATNVDAFVRLVESGFPVRATEIDAQIVLTSN